MNDYKSYTIEFIEVEFLRMFMRIRRKLSWFKRNFIFRKEFDEFNIKSKECGTDIAKWEDKYPCLNDKTSSTGFDSHYLYHPAWAARILSVTRPKLHIDISSILYFSAMISAFVPTKYYEYRPTELNLSNLETGHADVVNLPFEDNSIESLSCMHVIEHIGLGRYGDKMDPLGDKKAMEEIKRVVAPAGSLLFVVPIGKQKIMFNAHRIYSYQQIVEYFRGWELKEFALVPDDHLKYGFIRNATHELADKQNYGCGCFWFKK